MTHEVFGTLGTIAQNEQLFEDADMYSALYPKAEVLRMTHVEKAELSRDSLVLRQWNEEKYHVDLSDFGKTVKEVLFKYDYLNSVLRKAFFKTSSQLADEVNDNGKLTREFAFAVSNLVASDAVLEDLSWDTSAQVWLDLSFVVKSLLDVLPLFYDSPINNEGEKIRSVYRRFCSLPKPIAQIANDKSICGKETFTSGTVRYHTFSSYEQMVELWTPKGVTLMNLKMGQREPDD